MSKITLYVKCDEITSVANWHSKKDFIYLANIGSMLHIDYIILKNRETSYATDLAWQPTLLFILFFLIL